MGEQIRELWERLQALEARVNELEEESEDWFEVSSEEVQRPDSEPEGDSGGVGSDISEGAEWPI